jgi:hypothetical protein
MSDDATERALELLAASDGILATSPTPSRASVRSAHTLLDESLSRLGAGAGSAHESLRAKARRVRSALRVERRRRVLRWLTARASLRMVLVTAAILVASAGVVWYRERSNLLRGVSPVLSSEWARCDPQRGQCRGFSTRILFHTHEQLEPHVQYDLGGVRSVHSLLVQNRRDAHQDRAVPLVASVSVDGVTFREVARQSYWFELWKADFAPVEARYFRLSVARVSILHLERVELR